MFVGLHAYDMLNKADNYGHTYVAMCRNVFSFSLVWCMSVFGGGGGGGG